MTNGPALSLKLAAIVAALETLALAGAGIWLLLAAVQDGGDSLPMALSSGGFVLAGSLLLAAVTVALYRGRPWCHGPLVAIQLLLLPLGYQFLGDSTVAIGAGFMLAAVAVLVLVFLPSSTQALQSGRHDEPSQIEQRQIEQSQNKET